MFSFLRNSGYISYISNISVLLTFLFSNLKLSSDYLLSPSFIYMHVSVRADLSLTQQIVNTYKSVMNMLCEILKLSRLFKIRIEQTIKVKKPFSNKIVVVYFLKLFIICTLEAWTLRAADQKYLESFEMLWWRRMEKISWTDHMRNEEVLLRVNEQRNILHEIRKRKANWIGHILLLYIYIYIYMHVCVCVYILYSLTYIYIYVCVCVCVHMPIILKYCKD
jgi:hypothetical protein